MQGLLRAGPSVIGSRKRCWVDWYLSITFCLFVPLLNLLSQVAGPPAINVSIITDLLQIIHLFPLRSKFQVSISSKIVFLSAFLGHSKFTRVLDSLRHSVAGGIVQETAHRFESLPLLTVGRIRRSIGSQSRDKFFPKRSLNATCVDTIQSQLQ